MKNELVLLVAMASCMACTGFSVIEIPEFPNPPLNWSEWNESTILNSECPMIAGVYLQPPNVFSSGENGKIPTKSKMDLYSGYIPFYLADRKEKKVDGKGKSIESFTIRQPNADEFYFSYLTQDNVLVGYHFNAVEDDFRCSNGHLVFPVVKNNMMIEGVSMNFQIRNAFIQDKSGALVIHSTRGPVRGNVSNLSDDFSYEFIRYSPSSTIEK